MIRSHCRYARFSRMSQQTPSAMAIHGSMVEASAHLRHGSGRNARAPEEPREMDGCMKSSSRHPMVAENPAPDPLRLACHMIKAKVPQQTTANGTIQPSPVAHASTAIRRLRVLLCGLSAYLWFSALNDPFLNAKDSLSNLRQNSVFPLLLQKDLRYWPVPLP